MNYFVETQNKQQDGWLSIPSLACILNIRWSKNNTSSILNKLEALLTDDARVVIYNRHVFIVQSTESCYFISMVNSL